ncbi:SMP-30/gluconolactonase/LRE family protein [Ramlibacter rhizophilus]|uniref:SMP-30/gluconolactonase/LRE family protein n=1 Tax=Ramlibacter rhizophilus TaxID=1781167 RepID=A0A4Z0C2P5_9BURK|nr:SMP-30/gluconolactonase/LRE family protein [Ramlibacter rhizophilus]TFZ04469.1 SMP-30/gluconolactonase/LRE family protein [Ramlibacter rhizophilus]
MDTRRLGNLKTQLGECPLWHGGRLWLLDCRAGLIHALDADSGAELARHAAPAPLGSFAFNGPAGDEVVLALKEEVAALDLRSGRLRTLARLGISHPQLRLNDGTSLPDGSFVVGTMHVPREERAPPLGGLYRLGTDLVFTRLDEGYGVTNGPCLDPVTGRLHVADSESRVIFSYALAPDGTLSDKQVFVRTDTLGSGPDGCAFDSEGGLWTALVRQGALGRFDGAGRLTHRIALPLAHPTALCFGGAEMGDLFVTSISDSGRLKASGPLDGAVLKITGLGFSGVARPECRMPAAG